MDAFLASVPVHYWWLVAGALFCVLEILGISGIGFLFAGMAGLCVGIAVTAQWIAPESYLTQTAWFFGLTLVWAALLWKKLRPRAGVAYKHMVGERARVTKGPLVKGKTGSAEWSGTVMNAELSKHASVASVAEGENVIIKEVHGNVLVVAPE